MTWPSKSVYSVNPLTAERVGPCVALLLLLLFAAVERWCVCVLEHRHGLRVDNGAMFIPNDRSKKRLIQDTQDWQPRTGTTQSRSFRMLAQLTGTDYSKLGALAWPASSQGKSREISCQILE